MPGNARRTVLARPRTSDAHPWETPDMIMMLPFLTGLAGTWFGIRGHRRISVGFWLLTFLIVIAWLKYHMSDSLPISL